MIVTGPSFIMVTCISAPNSPVWQFMPLAFIFSIAFSYSGTAISGLAASVKLGLFPFLASP